MVGGDLLDLLELLGESTEAVHRLRDRAEPAGLHHLGLHQARTAGETLPSSRVATSSADASCAGPPSSMRLTGTKSHGSEASAASASPAKSVIFPVATQGPDRALVALRRKYGCGHEPQPGPPRSVPPAGGDAMGVTQIPLPCDVQMSDVCIRCLHEAHQHTAEDGKPVRAARGQSPLAH